MAARGRLRHIAIAVKDPFKAAQFYKHAFGLEIIGESDGTVSDGVFMSDGIINIFLVHYKSEKMALGKPLDHQGVHHIGFWVDDAEDTAKRIKEGGGEWRLGEPSMSNAFYEVKYSDPEGIIIDVTHNGWAGSRKDPGGAQDKSGPPSRGLNEGFAERRREAEKEFAAAVEKAWSLVAADGAP